MKIGSLFSRLAVILVLIPSLGNFTLANAGPAQAPEPVQAQIEPLVDIPSDWVDAELEAGPAAPTATCGDSPTGNGGVALDECQGTSFTLAGNTWDLSVYYTLDTADGNDWILTHTQVTPILGWMQAAYEAYYEQTGRTYGSSVCGRHIRAKIMQGDGWAGIAWWPNSCYIGLDAPMIRGNGGQHTTMHEMRHKVVQFAYPNCLSDWKPDYPGTTTYIVEGDADYGPSTIDDYGYMNSGYNQSKSLNEHGYNNMFSPYYSEHVDLYAGPWGSPGDADYQAGGMVEHWEECEAQGDLYVQRDVVQAFTPFTMEEFFLNFFAALYLHSYADPVTQPELYFFEEDAPGVTVTYAPTLADSVSLASGSKSWLAQTTPDTWAGKTYEIIPQAGCDYLMLEGTGTGTLGWAYMAADTGGTPSADYSGWVGTEFSRVFAAHGAYNKIGVSVVAFGHNYTYDLTATCVSPQIEIKRPLNPNFVAFVGDPLSPVAFIAYMKVTSGSGTPVTGIPTAWFVLDVEGTPVTATSVQEITKGYYLGVFLPPAQPVGTTWKDLRACLGTTGICDKNVDALLYVPPGNMDMVLLQDASGSMGDIDVPGDLSRLEQAKRAAGLLVQLAQVGDYYGIMDFSAKDIPAGCAPNCAQHDIKLVYPKTEITNPAVQIPAMQAAISTMTDRDWTNLGEGLRQAQLEVLGTPYSDNNKAVTILSDGEENVNPLYDVVAPDIEVIVNTMGFSGEAPNDLLARIAAENGGDFLYVPTTAGTAMAVADAAAAQRQAAITSIESVLTAEGIELARATQMAEIMAPTALYVPGGLALRDAYDYRQADATGASRTANNTYTGVTLNEWRVQSSNVSAADNKLVLVSSGVEYDTNGCGWNRDVQVLMPGAGQREWIPISPPKTVPPNWDVRNSPYHDVLYVSNPMTGTWQIRTKEYNTICAQSLTGGTAPSSVAATTGNFLQTGKVYSTINVDGEIVLENGQGRVGDPVPLLGTVLTKVGATPGALVLAAIERPGGTVHLLWLRDDGASNDGAAGDGIYGNTYYQAVIGGAYNVTIAALGLDPYAPSQALLRVWKGTFYMEGPGPGDDPDDDQMPTWWERLYPCMDPAKYDSGKLDYDQDGLINWDEWQNGTDPCDPDTDDGGESDGSELANPQALRNPHWPNDDKVPPIFSWSARPLNNAILIRWSHPISYTGMILRVTQLGGRTATYEGGPTGTFTVPATNGVTFTVELQGATADGVGPFSDPETVQPKADPDAPSGAVLINYDAVSTDQRAVQLYVTATDIPLDGMPAQASGALASQWTQLNEVSGSVQMRFRNATNPVWTAWQPVGTPVPWQLPVSCYGKACTVEAQFRDAALNESIIVNDSIDLVWPVSVYLPLVMRMAP